MNAIRFSNDAWLFDYYELVDWLFIIIVFFGNILNAEYKHEVVFKREPLLEQQNNNNNNNPNETKEFNKSNFIYGSCVRSKRFLTNLIQYTNKYLYKCVVCKLLL